MNATEGDFEEESRMIQKAKTGATYALPTMIHIPMLLVSSWLIWGWLTLNDIRIACEQRGLDYEKELSALIPEAPSWQTRSIYSDGKLTSETVTIEPYRDRSMFGRLNPKYHRYRYEKWSQDDREKKAASVSYDEVHFLLFFVRSSENVTNVLFCFGIGYIMSLTLVLLHLMRNKEVSPIYYGLRPLAGAFVSASLFLFILGGGALIWETTSRINGLSIGVVAAAGSIFCERFPAMLSSALKGNES